MPGLVPAADAARILLAYDGTLSARRALRRCARMCRAGDDLAVICVSPDGGERDGHLEEAVRLLATRGIGATAIAASGDAAQAICVTAAREGYDTIVVGRRNAQDAQLLLLGRVASRVVSGATCDVVVVAG
jgi:nucleotide-binding universal stress UspA family protein